MPNGLTHIITPTDLRRFYPTELPALAADCRQYLIDTLDQCGGHFAASLGMVELTIALHYYFNTPTDTLVWDVGHQAYVHKMFTGRQHSLHTIKQLDGLAPFICPDETPYDSSHTGHACTAISVALGIALGKQLAGDNSHTIAIIGDAGLTGGLAFEALNHAATTHANLIILVNDNGMSISENVGHLSKHPLEPFFAALGIAYSVPIDGHDLDACLSAFVETSMQSGPRVIHARTQKGKGFAAAERSPIRYHHVTKQFQSTPPPTHYLYANVFGHWLCEAAQQHPELIAITPAMCEGSDLKAFRQQYPERYIDTGIAEQHALALAGGLANQGQKPVVAIYSTFLQRAYDQLIHDLALPQANALIAIDRAGLVGSDGKTHQGNYDISYLRCIPNTHILTPSNGHDLHHMLTLGLTQPGLVCVRYPKAPTQPADQQHDIVWGKAKNIRTGKRVAILNFGPLLDTAYQVAERLDVTLIDMRFVKPLDIECLSHIAHSHDIIATLEDHAIAGGAGSAVGEYLATVHYTGKLHLFGIPDEFIAHATREQQLTRHGLTARTLYQTLSQLMSNLN